MKKKIKLQNDIQIQNNSTSSCYDLSSERSDKESCVEVEASVTPDLDVLVGFGARNVAALLTDFQLTVRPL